MQIVYWFLEMKPEAIFLHTGNKFGFVPVTHLIQLLKHLENGYGFDKVETQAAWVDHMRKYESMVLKQQKVRTGWEKTEDEEIRVENWDKERHGFTWSLE